MSSGQTAAPRPLHVAAPVDAVGKAVTQAALDEAYARCKRAYEAAKAEKGLVLKAAE